MVVETLDDEGDEEAHLSSASKQRVPTPFHRCRQRIALCGTGGEEGEGEGHEQRE